jgi:CubicO group peptidase (beta-lactamase class C family)
MPYISKSGSSFVIILVFSGLLAGCAGRSFIKSPTRDISVENKIDEFVKAQMVKKQIPGLSLAVVKDSKVVYARGYGTASLELGVPATPDTVYALGSITKQFTAVAILLLEEDRKLNLDENITNYLDGMPAEWAGVTVRHLLTHTSGIKEEDWMGGRPEFSQREWKQEEVIKTCFSHLESKPGEKWSYNNAGYRLLGMIIEQVSGESYWDFLDERIFKPLGMAATRNSDPKVIIPNRAQGYVSTGNGYHIRPPVTPSAAFSEGALVSSVLDLAKWDAALQTEKILKKSSFEQMTTRAIKIPDYACYYGLGWYLYDAYGHKAMDHSGAILGFGAYIGRYTDDKFTVIVLANTEDADCTPIANQIVGLYVPALARRK